MFRSAVADETKEAEAESAEPTGQLVAESDVEIAARDQQTSLAQAEWKQLQHEVVDLKLKSTFLEGRLISLKNTRQSQTQEIEELLKKSGDLYRSANRLLRFFRIIAWLATTRAIPKDDSAWLTQRVDFWQRSVLRLFGTKLV